MSSSDVGSPRVSTGRAHGGVHGPGRQPDGGGRHLPLPGRHRGHPPLHGVEETVSGPSLQLRAPPRLHALGRRGTQALRRGLHLRRQPAETHRDGGAGATRDGVQTDAPAGRPASVSVRAPGPPSFSRPGQAVSLWTENAAPCVRVCTENHDLSVIRVLKRRPSENLLCNGSGVFGRNGSQLDPQCHTINLWASLSKMLCPPPLWRIMKYVWN